MAEQTSKLNVSGRVAEGSRAARRLRRSGRVPGIVYGGGADAPGVKEGGVLEQITRELNVEALPTAIPESIVHEVGEMQIGETILLSAVTAPQGVTLLDTLEETVLATLSPPKLQAEAE